MTGRDGRLSRCLACVQACRRTSSSIFVLYRVSQTVCQSINQIFVIAVMPGQPSPVPRTSRGTRTKQVNNFRQPSLKLLSRDVVMHKIQHSPLWHLALTSVTLHTYKRTTQGLCVPHLMCWETKGTSTTARRCCGISHDSGAGYKTADLLTYLLTSGDGERERKKKGGKVEGRKGNGEEKG